jgi:hypothetical protein
MRAAFGPGSLVLIFGPATENVVVVVISPPIGRLGGEAQSESVAVAKPSNGSVIAYGSAASKSVPKRKRLSRQRKG